ncbi:glycoside hydrolase family 75 protein [Athelia psychrophila]|uniref:Endo-chitosanase n=1 Tax=Athelia psychrophila TaxID=1759441 RepID=A0A166J1U0_9AGAM|nr:glycoside hydrolase family 75 protein [Fibularhizoctonia sp. CBS 109695]
MKSTFVSTIALLSITLASTVGASSHHAAFARRHHRSRSSGSAVSSAEKLNKATGGTPASEFEADASLPAVALAAAALKLKKSSSSYPISDGSKTISKIYTDWSTGKAGSALVFTADMDVDCDGIDYKCSKNPDGDDETDYGALAAYEVPYIVIPEGYVNAQIKLLPGNNIVAVICGGKMYYGIFGDTNGDKPEVIGEASWRFAQTCFGDSISGNNGHAQADVTYIVFTGQDAVMPSSALSETYITSFSTLKSMGDEFVGALASSIGLSHSASSSSQSSSAKTSSSTKETASATNTASSQKASATSASAGALVNASGSCNGLLSDVANRFRRTDSVHPIRSFQMAMPPDIVVVSERKALITDVHRESSHSKKLLIWNSKHGKAQL